MVEKEKDNVEVCACLRSCIWHRQGRTKRVHHVEADRTIQDSIDIAQCLREPELEEERRYGATPPPLGSDEGSAPRDGEARRVGAEVGVKQEQPGVRIKFLHGRPLSALCASVCASQAGLGHMLTMLPFPCTLTLRDWQ